ncbi:MAG: AAA family ATPase [Deltaproteobacteria bacterium]|nr:AAA family ATPase [Deltaproteobacteria bacterium]
MYVRSIELEHFRCFDHQRVELQVPRAGVELSNVSLLLGNNAAGKSTLLRALALATMSGIIDQSGFVPRYLVRFSGDRDERTARLEATVELERQDASSLSEGEIAVEKVGTRVIRRLDTERVESGELAAFWDGLYEEDSPSFLVLGYGATRREDVSEVFDPQLQRKLRSARYQRVAGLFEDQVALVPLNAWLHGCEPARLGEVIHLLHALLPNSMHLRGVGKNKYGDLIWSQDRSLMPQRALSDGYRGFIALVGDMLYQLQRLAPMGTLLTELSGLVLIDEVDLHLHPNWQRVVVPTFSRVFPRLQFVMTTHSPIVTGTLRAENVQVLELVESKDGWPTVAAKRPVESVHGLNADQILVSSYFGLSTTRAPDAVAQQHELARRAAQGDKDAAVEFIRRLTAGDQSEPKP